MTMAMTDSKPRGDVFLTHFERFENNGGPDWLASLRRSAMTRFAELGFPTVKDEEWRFTNLSPVARRAFESAPDGDETVSPEFIARFRYDDHALRLVILNGRFSRRLSHFSAAPSGVTVTSLSLALRQHGEIVKSHLAKHASIVDDAFTALNTALMTDGALVYVPRGVVLEQPIEILYVATGGDTEWAAHPRTLIVVEENAQAGIVESYVGDSPTAYFMNPVTEIVAGAASVIDHVRVTQETDKACHVGVQQLRQLRNSTVRSTNLTFGGGLVRQDVNTLLDGEGCNCVLNGLTLGRGRQHVDNHLRITHAKPHCDSREFYKGVYDGKSSGVFSGRIMVHQGAQKTDAKQTNMNLLLSGEAHVDSKPQLEIFADDVKCTHGATIGQLDDNAVFYLRSRGIPQDAARDLLVQAFAADIVKRMALSGVKSSMDQWVTTWLSEDVVPQEVV